MICRLVMDLWSLSVEKSYIEWTSGCLYLSSKSLSDFIFLVFAYPSRVFCLISLLLSLKRFELSSLVVLIVSSTLFSIFYGSDIILGASFIPILALKFFLSASFSFYMGFWICILTSLWDFAICTSPYNLTTLKAY